MNDMSVLDPAGDAALPAQAGVPVRGRPNAKRSKRVKSEATRASLCDATARLLEKSSLRSLKVSDITHLAGVAPSTFYIYFADIEEAVLALVDEAHRTMPDLAAIVRGFTLPTLEAGVRALVSNHLAFWDRNPAVLRVRNLAADEGEVRFREARKRMLQPMLTALSERVTAFRGADLTSQLTPMSVAVVISGSLERLAAVIQLRPSDRSMSRRRLYEAEVFLICEVLRGRGPIDGA